MSERSTWAGGAIAFVILVILTLSLAPGAIEKDLAKRSAETLNVAGQGFALVTARGRDLTLHGNAPDDVAAANALEQVRSVWGVRVVHDALHVGALKAPERSELPTSHKQPVVRAGYSAREQAAFAARINAETCQQLLDGLLAREPIYFESASAVIQSRSIMLLQHIATAAVHCPEQRLVISGHTADSGDALTDRRLSEQRAQAVGELLVSRGVSSSRLGIVGHGAQRPLASNATQSGRAMNQRIEITVEH